MSELDVGGNLSELQGRAWLYELADVLLDAQETPRGSGYLAMTNCLAHEIAYKLRRIADEMDD